MSLSDWTALLWVLRVRVPDLRVEAVEAVVTVSSLPSMVLVEPPPTTELLGMDGVSAAAAMAPRARFIVDPLTTAAQRVQAAPRWSGVLCDPFLGGFSLCFFHL